MFRLQVFIKLKQQGYKGVRVYQAVVCGTRLALGWLSTLFVLLTGEGWKGTKGTCAWLRVL